MLTILNRELLHAIQASLVGRSMLTLLRGDFAAAVDAFAAELQVRRAIDHIRSLDDHRLLDLGVRRKDIEQVVRHGRD